MKNGPGKNKPVIASQLAETDNQQYNNICVLPSNKNQQENFNQFTATDDTCSTLDSKTFMGLSFPPFHYPNHLDIFFYVWIQSGLGNKPCLELESVWLMSKYTYITI